MKKISLKKCDLDNENEWAEFQVWVTIISSISQAVSVLEVIISQKAPLKLASLAKGYIIYTTKGEAFASLLLGPEGTIQ